VAVRSTARGVEALGFFPSETDPLGELQTLRDNLPSASPLIGMQKEISIFPLFIYPPSCKVGRPFECLRKTKLRKTKRPSETGFDGGSPTPKEEDGGTLHDKGRFAHLSIAAGCVACPYFVGHMGSSELLLRVLVVASSQTVASKEA
jgi:hypothetical protein